MPVNYADGTFFVSVLAYPVVAAHGAVSRGHPWAAVLVAPVGLALGLVITHFGRQLLYLGMGAVLKFGEARKRWVQNALGLPLLGLYLALPMVIIGAGLYATHWGSGWVVRHLL
ncbi:MAG TPA: hypothetical protein VMB21_17495 [Candidatus Limnocylindria bacterium]|nr:hypothetical protein [Candidatus Limnocylindria bacterium]